MPLQAYEDLVADPLVFPIGGKLYTPAPLGIQAGLRLAGVIKGDDDSLKDAPMTDLWKLVMGGLWDEMVADNVPAEAVARVGMTVLADHQYGRATAVAMWETGADPEALAARAAANQVTSRPSKSSATARKTPSRVSTKTTSRQPVTRQPVKKTAPRSAGRTS